MESRSHILKEYVERQYVDKHLCFRSELISAKKSTAQRTVGLDSIFTNSNFFVILGLAMATFNIDSHRPLASQKSLIIIRS